MYVSRSLWDLAVITILARVDSQCMDLLSSKDKCHGRGKYYSSMSLRHCLSTCLNEMECLTLQWKTTKRSCFISSRQARAPVVSQGTGGQCLTIAKEDCQPFDHTCIEETPAQVYNRDVTVAPISETSCRVLCQLWSVCTAYTWGLNTCFLQKGWTEARNLGSSNESHLVHGRKKQHCKTGDRVVTFQYGANSNNAKKTDVSGNVTRCFDLVLDGSQYWLGVWDIQAGTCWVHEKTRGHRGFFGKKIYLIIFFTDTSARDLTQKACIVTKDRYYIKLSHGVRVPVSSQSECLHICLSTVNCHSVSWGGSKKCYLHQVLAPRLRNKKWSIHTVVPCPQDKPTARLRQLKNVVSWCWRRVFTDSGISDIRDLVLIPEVTSILQCCDVCNRASHCTGITWSTQRQNEKSCYIQRVGVGSPMWKFTSC